MQNKNYNLKALTESGIITAILIVTIFITAYIPILKVVTYLLLPAFPALIYVRNGFKYALLSSICSFIISSIFLNPVFSLILFVVIFLVGFTLIYCIKNNIKPYKSIIFLTISFIAANIIYLFLTIIFIYKSGLVSFVDSMVKQVNDYINMTKDLYINRGMSKDEVERIFSNIKLISTNEILWMIPFYITFTSIVSAFLNYKITSVLFSRLRINIQKLKGINYFYVPNLIGAFIIILVCIGLILRSRNIIIGEYIFNSTYLLLVVILTVNGIAASSYFLKYKLRFSNAFIVITILLIFMVMDYLFMIIGLIELIGDFRKIDSSRVRKIR